MKFRFFQSLLLPENLYRLCFILSEHQMANNAVLNLREDLRAHSIGTVERMKSVLRVLGAPQHVLDAQVLDVEWLDPLLDELQDLVSSIDMSFAFHSVGGLVTVLDYLKRDDPIHRGKAADVVATLVWGNLHSQQLVMEANGFETLFHVFSSDEDTHNRTQALGAICSLIRYNKPAITSFRLANGYVALRDSLLSGDADLQKKSLDLINLILQEDCGESTTMVELGYPRIMIGLAHNEDAQVRESALWGLLELARLMKDGNIKDDIGEAMKQLLQDRIQHICSLRVKELRVAREERMLVDSLWRTCFNEPSCLVQKHLLVLPGEDAAILSHFERQPFNSPSRRFRIEHTLAYYTSDEDSDSNDFDMYFSTDDSDSNGSTISTERIPPNKPVMFS